VSATDYTSDHGESAALSSVGTRVNPWRIQV
jgi:hypothetical protein